MSERNLLTTGVTVGFAGATITAINGLIGGRADGYTDAATSLRTSIGTFRDYLRLSELGARHLEPVGVGAPAAPGPPAGEAPADTARNAAIEARVRFAALRVFDDELCALRDACFRRQIDAIPVGRAFLAETSPTEADAARTYIDTHCSLRPELSP